MSGPGPGDVVLSRRLLAGAAAASLLGTAGCRTQGHPGEDVAAAVSGAPDPDEGLVDAAVRAEQRLLGDLVEVRRRFAVLRPSVRRSVSPAVHAAVTGAVAVHRRHLQVLTRALDTPPHPAPRPIRVVTPEQTLRELVNAEGALSQAHVRRAVAARSGPFARVLAGMAAAAAQQAHVLSDAAPTRTARRG